MAQQIKESDWIVFRELHPVALERFCQRVIEEAKSITASCTSFHDCYITLFDLMRRRDKELSRSFDDLRRSTALLHLANIKRQGLLTEEEWMQFSQETRETIEAGDFPG